MSPSGCFLSWPIRDPLGTCVEQLPAPTRAAHLEDPTAMCPLPLAPLSAAHERVVAGVPEGRHEVVALSIGVHFELGHGRLHLEDRAGRGDPGSM